MPIGLGRTNVYNRHGRYFLYVWMRLGSEPQAFFRSETNEEARLESLGAGCRKTQKAPEESGVFRFEGA